MPHYAELQTTTNFGFLRGASQPGELVLGAKALGLAAIGIADRNTLAGVVRAWSQGKAIGQRVLSGSRLVFADGMPEIVVYPVDRDAWARLTRLLTLGQRRAKKGECHLVVHDLTGHAEGQLMLVVPPAKLTLAFETCLRDLAGDHPGRVWLLASRPYGAQDVKRLAKLDALARRYGAPMVASNDVLYHGPARRALQDVLTCIREGCTIAEAGLRLEANAERHLKAADEMIRLFKDYPKAVSRTVEIAERIEFDLSHLKYEYPHEPVPPGKTAIGHLRDLAWAGAAWRFRYGITPDLKARLRDELALIEELNYPHYFLTVHDVVHWARSEGILCQGRGSAANSLVCFCLGVTAVDPTEEDHDMLFARFISRERDEPPDIDVDFEHDRREEVMQYVYRRYGRDRAAICATVIHYRPRSAIRDVGKALGLTEDVTSVLANTVWGSRGDGLPDEHIKQAGLDPKSPHILRAVTLATQLLGFPRHLSQHVGGFVLTERRLDETVPIGNGAMKDRTFIEWDKDDIDALGLMKVDILALGMLTAIKRAMDMLGIADMADIPKDDVAVYDMLSKADSVGVFQVESRAQMSMLPRMKPRRFYDLAIEVAIVRPGPIQGGMVHPYLKRREKLEAVIYPRPAPEHGLEDELKQVLGKTLGVPLFQEQAMRLAIEAAKFTPEEANGLRRAMATFRNHGDVGVYRMKFIDGMVRRGYDSEFAQRCFKQIEGFGSYGFPESHAISFAKLVYVSAWIKCHRPDVFCAALLNSQPMGFYQPAQLVRDAREHGVEVRPPDVMWSKWDCTLEEVHLSQREREEPSEAGRQRGEDGAEKGAQVCASSTSHSSSASRRAPPSPSGRGVLRLGLRQIRGLSEDEAEQLICARNAGARTLGEFAHIGDLSRSTLEFLAEADAFRSLGIDRRAALWAVKGMAHEARVETEAPLLAIIGSPAEGVANLPAMALSTHVAEDYRTTSLSLKAHPCQFLRPLLTELGAVTAESLRTRPDGSCVAVGGLVLIRQRPGTAKGIVFLTLEDETGSANAVVWKKVFTANRRKAMTASFLIVHGRMQRAGDVIHVVAERFTDLSHRLDDLKREGSLKDARLVKSRDFH